MRLPSLFLILFLLGCKSSERIPKGYDFKPVLLYVSDKTQDDSIGFNLVEEIPKLLYPRLLTGDLPMWETSRKKYQVSPERFRSLEQTSNYPFTSSQNIFIHEFWKIFKRNFEFGVAGFSFTGQTKSGKDISYGFVDAKDVIDLMKSTQIPSNANGSADLTFWDAIHTKQYPFTLVQFGDDNFKDNRKRSALLLYQAIFDPNVYRNFSEVNMVKEIEYRISPPDITSNKENKALFESLTKVVNDNKQTILNAGGDEHFSHLMFVPWEITSLSVVERWTQYKNLPFQQLSHIRLFVDKHPIDLNKEQLQELDARINLQGMEEYLSEKSFDFVLERINSQEIRAQESEKYYKALLNNRWDKIK